MATATLKRPKLPPKTMADLLERLGGISPERVWLDPPPGTATERDVLAASEAPEKRLCELIHGTLVEKAMGATEAMVASLVAHFILSYLDKHDLGLVLGADGMFRMRIGLVRMPDVAFISWQRLPEGQLPDDPIARRIPELAVEVLSPSNTPKEMAMKLADFFEAGVKLAWLIDPRKETAMEYTSPSQSRAIGKTQALVGHDVLPGFKLPLKKLFARTKRRGKPG
jgi:Uma2 family endonuclease